MEESCIYLTNLDLLQPTISQLFNRLKVKVLASG